MMSAIQILQSRDPLPDGSEYNFDNELKII
jgi:hypothetical protein